MSDPLIQRLEYLSAGDKSFQRELIELFLSESQKNLTIIDGAISENNLATAARAVHAIKGAALNVGAQELSTISEHVEHQLENGVLEPDKIQALKDQFQATNDKLRHFLASFS